MFAEKTGMSPQLFSFTTKPDGEKLKDEATLGSIGINLCDKVLHLQTDDTFYLIHFLQMTKIYPALISYNMTRELIQQYKCNY